MRILLLLLIFILNSNSLCMADDIKEFQIESISVGDSLLNHFNKQTIKSARKYKYQDDKFYSLDIWSDKFKQYAAIQFHLKKNDKKYIIHGLSGTLIFGPKKIYYPKSKNECKNQKEIIVDSITELFPNADINNYDDLNADDGYGGKAVRQETYFSMDVGQLWIQCITWGKTTKKKENLYDNLRLTLLSAEFLEWMNTANN